MSLHVNDYQYNFKYNKYNFTGNYFDDLDMIFRTFVWERIFKMKSSLYSNPINSTDQSFSNEQQDFISDTDIEDL